MPLGDFTDQAKTYQRSRPSYPEALIDGLVAQASIGRGDAVVDLGAGTGILTQMLIDRGLAVTAVEPNEGMLQHAEAAAANWVQGTFEDNGLTAGSQSWAVAAQAFHWSNPKTALPAIRRILKPHSVFSVLWNERIANESEILQWTAAAIERHIPEFDEAYRDVDWGAVLESTGDFTLLSKQTERHLVPMSQQRFLNLWRSHNRLNNIAGSTRFQLFLEELRGYLLDRRIEQIEVPYECRAWSARRVE